MPSPNRNSSEPSRYPPPAALLLDYGIDAAPDYRPVDEGLLNRSFRVRAGQETYFLKQYLDQGSKTIRAQHAATRALARAGLPALPPLADRDGRTLLIRGGRHYALFPWVLGEHLPGPTLTTAQCTDLGALLARMHEALCRILGPVGQPLFQPADTAAQAEATAMRLLRRLRSRARRDGIDDLAEFRLEERISLLRQLAGRRPPDDAVLTAGHVHGDFHGLNVLYSSAGAVRAVVDWDRLSVGPCLEELVRSALIIFVDPVDGTLELDRVRAYVRGYVSVRPRFAEELPLAVHRLWWERLTDFWMLIWRYERDDPRPDRLFPSAAALVLWWTHHYEKVLESFRG
ncbi:MAG TPA: phosphotransferase [Actinocrinis sp.]|jgi:homoserine kinase type II